MFLFVLFSQSLSLDNTFECLFPLYFVLKYLPISLLHFVKYLVVLKACVFCPFVSFSVNFKTDYWCVIELEEQPIECVVLSCLSCEQQVR